MVKCTHFIRRPYGYAKCVLPLGHHGRHELEWADNESQWIKRYG